MAVAAEVYTLLLKDLGFEVHEEHEKDLTKEIIKRQPVTPQIEEDVEFRWEKPTQIFQYTFHQLCGHKSNVYKKSPYQRKTHFKEHLRRLQAREEFTFPEHVHTVFETFPYSWKDPDIYQKCRLWMKQHKIHRKYYEHIFLLVKMKGGYVLRIHDDLEYEWIQKFPMWERYYNYKLKTPYQSKNFPFYLVLISVLCEKYNVYLPYYLPQMKGDKRYIVEDYFEVLIEYYL